MEEKLRAAEEKIIGLQEELKYLLLGWNRLVEAIEAPCHGTAIGHAKQVMIKINTLQNALKKYGKHTNDCNIYHSWHKDRQCDCGYNDLIKEIGD